MTFALGENHAYVAPMNVIVDLARASQSYQPAEPGSTRDLLIVAAERLFAERGIEGVSLRTICLEAGQGNTRALQYHFADRSGIVNAILLTRMVQIEKRRAELLESQLATVPRLVDLLDVLLRPVSELVSDDGRNLYARFLSHVLTHTYWWGHFRADGRSSSTGPKAGTELVLELVQERLARLTGERLTMRMTHILRMFLGAIVDHENTLLDGGTPSPLEEVIREQLNMAAAALDAPL